ncbi:hypothetical protein EDD17DRAFT_475454 [Pisolithus thermaeus]|nr:hypothetical protein EV401DRAFT_2066005 [Pisolithus croceorrhizus]KAI6163531.1 hypothetical protein EDD17DRAFT_475454 [Pisolithus thermaeus]
MPPTHAGIVHQPPGQSTLAYLPLQKVAINAWVVDVSARLVLTQVFQNESDQPTARAKYVFPLPERSAVCAFELEHADGRVIVGTVEESEDAARTFAAAIAAGQTAALVERVTDDIFAISAGSIPAGRHVTTRITFIMDLLDEGPRDHVRLQLPMAIFERYGPPPDSMVGAASATSTTRIDIKVDVQTSDIIHAIRSPTHSIKVLRYKTHSGRKSQRRMSASWSSPTFENRDFVLTVYADGLDKPRCFAEIDTQANSGEIGMQLTLVPSFKVPRNPSQEYLFVIDISGSMAGARIETAKHTLLMLLRLLPCTQTIFNIFRFGSEVRSLWTASHDFNQDSMDQTITHVGPLAADGGGTDIPKALKAAIGSRQNDRPTAIFLLTDGEVHDEVSRHSTDIVAEAVRRSSPQAPLRVFVLGIADATSSACEGIARAGNGECLFAVSHEYILGKCARLLNAGRTKKIESIVVDWGVTPMSAVPPARNATSPRLAGNGEMLELEPPPALQQVPHTLTRIFAGVRFTVFAIISPCRIPSSIKLFTKFDGIDEPMEWVVPVTEVKPFKDADCEIPLIHTLAARKLITELSEGRAPLPAVVGSVVASDDEIKKAAIVRLGLWYQLASQYTSFVAVHVGDEQPRGARRGQSRPDTGWMRTRRRLRSLTAMQQTRESEGAEEEADNSILSTVLNSLTAAFSFALGMLSGSVPATNSSSDEPQNVPGSYTDSELSLDADNGGLRGRAARRREESTPRRYSADTVSTMSSLEGSCSACWTPSRSPSPDDPIVRSPSPELIRDAEARPAIHPALPQISHPPGTTSTVPPTVSKEAYEVFQLLGLNGSFSPTAELARIVGSGILEKANELGADEKLWATVVAVAYLKKNLENEPDLLEVLVAKTGDFVMEQASGRGTLPRNFEDMVRYASELLEAEQGTTQ